MRPCSVVALAMLISACSPPPSRGGGSAGGGGGAVGGGADGQAGEGEGEAGEGEGEAGGQAGEGEAGGQAGEGEAGGQAGEGEAGGQAGEGEAGGQAGEGEGGEGEGGEGETGGEGGVGGEGEAPLRHRPVALACDPERAELGDPGGGEPMEMEGCTKHEDCDEGINGRCQHERMGRQCTYDGCFEDDDCDPGRVCRCRGSESAPHVCMRSGNCQVNADCGEGGFCSPSMGDCGDYVGIIGWFCHTNEDDCVDDVDCGGDGGGQGDYCAFNPAGGRWMCSDSHCDG